VARFGADFSLAEGDDSAPYGLDRTKGFVADPGAVVFPRTPEEVVAVVKECASAGVAIVPSGGRTGLAGGAVAASGELVLSLRRLNQIDEVDPIAQTVRVGAGAITEAVHEHCQEVGLTWPIDLASKGSCQIGGNIATNAGGVRVIRYGHTRNWVLGLEVVTAAGEILELGGLEKDNTGLDLKHVFIGTEGTLGIITAATLKLTPFATDEAVLLFSLPSFEQVLSTFASARAQPFDLAAFEFFDAASAARVTAHRGTRPPFSEVAPYYALVAVEGKGGEVLDTWLLEMLQVPGVEGVIASSQAQARSLWALREDISESLSSTGIPYKSDVSVPVSQLASFVPELVDVATRACPGWEICLFGHIGDGNIHLNVIAPDGMDEASFFAHMHAFEPDVAACLVRHDGSVSAEHGIGLLKKDLLLATKAPAQLDLMRRLKRAWDPGNLFNPGKIFDP
jgi:FAD/FMN-containing dehydrogenase